MIKSKHWMVVIVLGIIFTYMLILFTDNPFNCTKINFGYEEHSETGQIKAPQPLAAKKNFFDGCHHVYLDVGTNIGIQIRKLFEPTKYESALIHPVFEEYFHRKIEDLNSSLPYICAVGFEPNPNHEKILKDLNDAYDKCNWKAKILTQTAVSDHDGIGNFYTDYAYQSLEWGGTIFERSKVYGTKDEGVSGEDQVSCGNHEALSCKDCPQGHGESYCNGDCMWVENECKAKPVGKQNGIPIELIRLATYINNDVAQRKLPKNVDEKVLGKPSVVMKMDIEGSEVEVIEDLVMQGSLQYIDIMMVEFHDVLAQTEEKKNSFRNVKDFITKIGDVSEYLKQNRENVLHSLKVVNLDDESYFHSNYPLPIC